MNKYVLTVDSGICAKKKDDLIIIPAQIVSSSGESFPDNGNISNKEIIDNMKNGRNNTK